jgi:hypothetical protein
MKMIIHCGHHKCGSVLFGNVLRKVCKHLNLTFRGTPGPEKKGIYDSFDVAIFANSTIDLGRITRPYTGTHVIRDPRDIIVSGYLYHARCDEKWCTNIPDLTAASYEFPQVPHSQYYRPDEWKLQYLRSLNGSSYQANLNRLDQHDGILFEMNKYGRWTIERMLDWDYENPHMLEMRFEDVMRDFTGSFEQAFRHYGFDSSVMQELLDLASTENMHSLSDREIAESSHIHSRQTSKWKEYFSSKHKRQFKEMFGDALVRLGYEKDNNW